MEPKIVGRALGLAVMLAVRVLRNRTAGISLMLLVLALVLAWGPGMAMADPSLPTLAPEVVIGPDDHQCVRLQVADQFGAGSWMYLPLAASVVPSEHQTITVAFDIYRVWDGQNNENMRWMWAGDIDPFWGAQWDHYGPANPHWTYPFGWVDDDYEHAETVFDRWVTLEMEWDLGANTVSSSYAGSQIDINQPLCDPGTSLYGYQIQLVHEAATGTGPEIAYIDNFRIVGSNIYDSLGFEGFELGPLNGQDGWEADIVPEPATLSLLALGGLAMFRRRRTA